MAIFNRIKSWLSHNGNSPTPEGNDDAFVLAGRYQATLIKSRNIEQLSETEFKVFSQWGDDGIIQYLISKVGISKEVFIEFGVENYTEANTKFLLMNNNWKGLIMDGSKEHINFVKAARWFWKYDLTARAEFVTRENINSIFEQEGFVGPIGLLSIDVDGNDYWIWSETNAVDPDIVIVEYNSVLGDTLAVTIPYDPGFHRTKAHASNLYWGVSLRALVELGDNKGYAFVGSNQSGNNAYFVKKAKAGSLRSVTTEEGYRVSRFRESRDEQGNLTYLSGLKRLQEIADMKLVELHSGKIGTIRELYNL